MNDLKVYLAGPFAWRDRLHNHARELRSLGVQVGCRWLTEPGDLTGEVDKLSPEYCATTAAMDLEDIAMCNTFILFTLSDEELENPALSRKALARGGRHAEFGYACALRLLNAFMAGGVFTAPRMIVCGPKENIFHSFDPVKQFDNWDQTINHLLTIAHAQESNAS